MLNQMLMPFALIPTGRVRRSTKRMHSREYRQHFNLSDPAYWDWRRKWLGRLAPDGRCNACGFKGPLEIHHINYRNLSFENDDDLEALCETCHDKADERDAWWRRVDGWGRRKYGADWRSTHDEDAVEEELVRYLERRGER